jgi:hypothetical protein
MPVPVGRGKLKDGNPVPVGRGKLNDGKPVPVGRGKLKEPVPVGREKLGNAGMLPVGKGGREGRGIDGRGIEGSGIDGRGIDGRGIDGSGIEMKGAPEDDGRGVNDGRSAELELSGGMLVLVFAMKLAWLRTSECEPSQTSSRQDGMNEGLHGGSDRMPDRTLYFGAWAIGKCCETQNNSPEEVILYTVPLLRFNIDVMSSRNAAARGEQG